MKTSIGILIVLVGLPAAAQTPEPKVYEGSGLFSGIKSRYLPRPSPAVDYANSARLDKLMRAGRIYLSLPDAIALALENNLDIEFARYGPRVADTDVQRASAGQLLRNLGGTNIRSGPRSATGALAGVSGVSAGGGGGASSQGGILSGVSVQLAGSAIPNLDPQAFFQGQFGHSTQIITNSFATGTNYLVSGYKATGYGITKGFLTGTSVRLDMSSQNLSQNSPRNDFNPATSGNLGFSINQHLLQGFGLALNSRVIKIAKNNRHAADLSFKSQVIATVANVADLYWDLVTYNENLRVRQQALELNQRLYTDNKRRAELGAIAPIDIVQAEAEVAASQQEVTNAETQVLQQEMILKSVLTRNGLDDMAIMSAHIVPTDKISVPEAEPVEPVQDLVAAALANRPEIEQSHISLENSRLSMQGTKNALMPTLDVFASMQNNALAGQVNTVTLEGGAARQAIIAQRTATTNPFFVGGYGTFVSQLFRRNFPDYAIGFSFSVPLSNRAAQADYIKDQLNYRQQQINDRQMNNNIRLSVINARTALMQARAAYDTSVKARMLQEQTLNGERRKFHLGTSSFLNVVIVQRDAVARQAAEVAALNNYIRARNNLQSVTGRILKEYNVSMEEAYSGIAKREPDIVIPERNGK
jgi:outer membrane protein TolC